MARYIIKEKFTAGNKIFDDYINGKIKLMVKKTKADKSHKN